MLTPFRRHTCASTLRRSTDPVTTQRCVFSLRIAVHLIAPGWEAFGVEKECRVMGAHRVYRERNYAFGQQLLTLRTRAGLTQIALASHIGVSRRSVQNWETGEFYPKAETLQRLIAVFLSHHAFPEGQERAEAQALWSQAAQHGPHPLGAFDAASFARLLAERSSTPAPARAAPTPLAPASALDRVLPEG